VVQFRGDLFQPGLAFEDMIRGIAKIGVVAGTVEDPDTYIRERMRAHRNPGAPIQQQMSDGTWVLMGEHRTGDGGTFLIRTDMTELKKAEEAMQRAREEAETANRAKSEFLANMSHELRTPLNAVIGFSDMIRRETFGPVGSPKYLEYVNDINESGTHLLELITDILDLSKVEAGKLELHEQNVDVSRVVRSCLTLVKERAEARGVEVKCDSAPNLPGLSADERKLKQILINLMSNAIKFTPSGGEITVRNWVHRDDGYVFQISDTGIGMAREDIPKALTPFRQVDNNISRKYDGTGLGLPLTKALTELHGGSLDLQSEVGVGTTVTVRFPTERILPQAATGT